MFFMFLSVTGDILTIQIRQMLKGSFFSYESMSTYKNELIAQDSVGNSDKERLVPTHSD